MPPAMSPPVPPAPTGEPAGDQGPGTLRRFGAAERAVHWTLAGLMFVCLLTAAVLYNGSISVPVGHRHIVELIHVYSGFALPVPVLIGLLSPSFRADVRRLNRFSTASTRCGRRALGIQGQ